jgi:hypothetical protein
MSWVLTNVDRYFIVGNLARSPEEVVRIAALLRGTESAVQAVSVSPQPHPGQSCEADQTDTRL